MLKVAWPKLGRPIWDHFRKLGRPPSMDGLAAITAQEILAHQQLHSVKFTPWELEMIEVFDAIAMESASKRNG